MNTLPDQIRIDVFQDDGIEAFAAYDPGDATCKPEIRLCVERILGMVAMDDIDPKDVPYVVAESLMHEMIHALEDWAGLEFNEERVYELIAKYREQN